MTHSAPQARIKAADIALIGLALLLFAGFMSLGIWQVERRAWKLDLIARVDQRVHAPAAPLASSNQWPQVSVATDEYRHLQVSGRFLNDRETLVKAVTRLGSGFWVMTPFELPDGRTLLVNRGFVPPESRERGARSATEINAPVTLTGVLRLSEPSGGFLRHNDAPGNHWYSRDVDAIAQARSLQHVAPFFLDADGPAVPATVTTTADQANATPAWPVGGLTVISFSNNHLIYALTWFGLALMVPVGGLLVLRERRQQPAAS